MTDLFHPSLPYNGHSGHVAGSETSKARAMSEDASGVTASRQKQILEALQGCKVGYTWKELAGKLGLHHGQISGALSALHKDGWVFALKQERNGSQIYMHYGYRDEHGAAMRLDFPAVTRSSVKKAAIDDLAKAVEVFLETRTFQTEDQLRAAFNVYNSLTYTD